MYGVNSNRVAIEKTNIAQVRYEGGGSLASVGNETRIFLSLVRSVRSFMGYFLF
jgi:hypothetical protein